MVRKPPHKKQPIEWRSHEPSRLETFSDAVFAFALTLIVVSIEVPKSFNELFETMKGGIAFAACFAVLFYIWNAQNLYFRRYGLNDNITGALNGVLLFVVLIYVYPMKFLATLMFSSNTYQHDGHLLNMITDVHQVTTLMLIYGMGYAVINLIFYLMYRNALRMNQHLELTPKEIFETKTIAGINLITVFICLFAMLMAILLPVHYSGWSGFFYFLIPLAYSTWYSYRGKKSRLTFE